MPLLGWFAYPPLLAVLLALLAVVLGFGKELGAPSLVWHYDLLTQTIAGLAATALCVHLGVVGYLLDSGENPDQDVAPDEATFGSVVRYTLWPVGALWLATVWGAFRQTETPHHGALVLIGPMTALVIFAWLAGGPLESRPISSLLRARDRERLMRLIHRVDTFLSARRPTPNVDPGAHAVQAFLMGALLVFYGVVWIFEPFVPAALAVSVALSIATGLWGLLRFWMRRFRVVGILLLAGFACVVGVTGDIPATGLSKVAFPIAGDQPRLLLPDQAVLEKWVAPFGKEKPPLVVVATSGGASRAAVWTINVLSQLDQRIPGFLRHVRIITGASGGMVGAAHLVSALGPSGLQVPIDEVLEGAARDSLTDVTRALILPRSDRGRALEAAWERNTMREVGPGRKESRLQRPFRDLMTGEAEGWRPSLVYAPMLVEDGRRLVVSNLDLTDLTVSSGPVAGCTATDPSECLQSRSAFQLFSCRGEGIDEIKLSTVARLSATFPWVTSAALLTTTPDRRIVDAGYYDNFGVDLGALWIRKNAAWLREHTSGVLLIQIRDDRRNALDVKAKGAPGRVHRWVSAVTTPIEAFLKAREATMSFRNDEQIALLASDPDLAFEKEFLITRSFELGDEAPLQWYLTRAAIDRLKRPPPEIAFHEVERWWAARQRRGDPAAAVAKP